LQGFHQQVVVVVHEAIGPQPPFKAFADPFQDIWRIYQP
jgi:dienelactone hydrolase